VMPASPGFYALPRTISDLVDAVVSRLLDRLGVPNELMRRWDGMAPRSCEAPTEVE
jgi:4-hydroxy-3-polyprenylbenzoate decarboxylase